MALIDVSLSYVDVFMFADLTEVRAKKARELGKKVGAVSEYGPTHGQETLATGALLPSVPSRLEMRASFHIDRLADDEHGDVLSAHVVLDPVPGVAAPEPIREAREQGLTSGWLEQELLKLLGARVFAFVDAKATMRVDTPPPFEAASLPAGLPAGEVRGGEYAFAGRESGLRTFRWRRDEPKSYTIWVTFTVEGLGRGENRKRVEQWAWVHDNLTRLIASFV